MRKGTISSWDNDTEYGFIDPNDQGSEVLFHLSVWKSRQLPKIGEVVQFDHEIERDMSLQATEVISIKQQQQNKYKKWVFNVLVLLFLLGPILVFSWPRFIQPLLFPQKIQVTQIVGDKQIDYTIALIQKGGPFPYPLKDGSVFYNHEGRLPNHTKGYYHEYTVPTPNINGRGPRRIVTGGTPPEVFYYTPDHYQSFMQLEVK